MWQPRSFSTLDTKPGSFPYLSSGEPVHRLIVDDTVFSNALECSNWEMNPIQLRVCEECGRPWCDPQYGWMSLRSSGKDIIFLPAFSEIESSDLGFGFYRPPFFAGHQNQAVFLSQDMVGELQSYARNMPPQTDLPNLTYCEVARLIQWEAPFDVLGVFPGSLKLNREVFVTASWENVEEVVEILEKLIGHALSSQAPAVLIPRKPDDILISFFLADIGFVDWKPLAFSDGDWHFHLEPGYLVKSSQG